MYLLPGYEDGTNDDADSDVVKEWRSDTRTMLEESSKMGYGGGEGGSEDADKGKNDIAGGGGSGGESGGAEVAVGVELPYNRHDASDAFGPLGKDAMVQFDVCLDMASGRNVARSVCLSDEAVPSLYHDDGSTEAAPQCRAGT